MNFFSLECMKCDPSALLTEKKRNFYDKILFSSQLFLFLNVFSHISLENVEDLKAKNVQ